MAFPSGAYMLVRFGGALPGGEDWRTGQWWHFTGGTPGIPDWVDAASDVGLSFVQNFWDALTGTKYRALNTTAVHMSRQEAYLYVDGVLTDESLASITDLPGTEASNSSPPYVACCFTLQTASFGRSARGRAYLPYTVPVVLGTGQLNIAQVQADHFADYLNKDSITPLGPATEPVVLSRKQGVARPITRVRVDTVPDTQHGRNRSVTPTSTFFADV